MNPGMILLIMMLANGGSGRGAGSLGNGASLGNGGLLRGSRNMFSVQTADDFLAQLHRTVDTLDRVSSITHSISALQLPSPASSSANQALQRSDERRAIEPPREYSSSYDPYNDIINAEPVEYGSSSAGYAPDFTSAAPTPTPAPFSLPNNVPDIGQLMQTFGPMLQMLSKQNT